MGTYEDLKAAIQQVIRTNDNNEITGALLQQTLLSIVNSVGANATFAGIATPDTNPGTADQNVYYLATEAGTYVNFGGIEIAEGEAVILSNKTGNWTKTTSGFATQQQLTKLELESEMILASRPIAEGDNGNMIPYDSIIDNHYYDATTGARMYSANWKCTPLIPIKPNTLYAKSVILQINEFDKELNHIRYIPQADESFTSSDNAAYVAGSFINQFKETARFNEGATLNTWVEGKKLFLMKQIKDLENSFESIETKFDDIEELIQISNENFQETINKTEEKITENKQSIQILLGTGIQLFNANSKNIVTGQFINYDSGEISEGANNEWLKIPIDSSKGYITTSGTTNLHIAFFDNLDTYISGVLVAWNEPTKTFEIPANASFMTVSVKIADANALMVNYGKIASDWQAYQEILNIQTIPNQKRIVKIKSGESILRAMKNYGENTIFLIEAGVYDMVSDYKDVYGADFFSTYVGYAGHYDDLFYAGYYLADGVELIGEGEVTIRFDYDEGSKNTDNTAPDFDAVAQYFSPINTSQNNIVRNINVVIGYDYSCRYHVHDDFAAKAGNNVFQNMTLRGRSSKFTSFGCGMGTANTYLLENICILTGDGYSISYHNSSLAGKNKLIIKDCYCEGNIMARMMGESTEKTEVLVCGCKADAIVLNYVDQENQPNENMELRQWNNIIG